MFTRQRWKHGKLCSKHVGPLVGAAGCFGNVTTNTHTRTHTVENNVSETPLQAWWARCVSMETEHFKQLCFPVTGRQSMLKSSIFSCFHGDRFFWKGTLPQQRDIFKRLSFSLGAVFEKLRFQRLCGVNKEVMQQFSVFTWSCCPENSGSLLCTATSRHKHSDVTFGAHHQVIWSRGQTEANGFNWRLKNKVKLEPFRHGATPQLLSLNFYGDQPLKPPPNVSLRHQVAGRCTTPRSFSDQTWSETEALCVVAHRFHQNLLAGRQTPENSWSLQAFSTFRHNIVLFAFISSLLLSCCRNEGSWI